MSDDLKELKFGLKRWKGYWPAIAKAAKVDYNTVALIARGERDNPRIKTIKALLRVINRLDGDIEYRDKLILRK